ncbi:MAG: HAMP domain-containing sensor histidine kinase [Pseudomonadota bacterium]
MGRLFWKFLLAFWLALLVAGGAVGTSVWLHHRSLERDSGDIASGPRAALMVSVAAQTLRHGGVASLQGLLSEGMPGPELPVYAVDESGRELLGRKVALEALEKARRMAGSGEAAAHWVSAPDGRGYLLFSLAPTGMAGPDLRSPPPMRNDMQDGIGGFVRSPDFVPPEHRAPPRPPAPWLLLFAGLVASLAFSAALAWYFARPVRHLRWALKSVEEGRLNTRVQAAMGGRRDEISDLGADFDRMAQQIENLVGAQKRLLHDVSHELRSPLARLQVAVELARQQPERVAGCLERIERESERLDRLVGEVLTLARLESGIGMGDGARAEVILGDILASVVEDARFEADSSGRIVELNVDVPAGADRVRGSAELLHRALENVIRNAVHHTRAGCPVHVGVCMDDEGRNLILTVDDQGTGVPEGELESIFEPFHRAGGTGSIHGHGLGLAITRHAIEAHGGRVQASNREGGGLRIRIVLPRNV